MVLYPALQINNLQLHKSLAKFSLKPRILNFLSKIISFFNASEYFHKIILISY
ncbi:MAG: hypothetical protein LBC61_06850 [Candidatus Peribacteria bacterium]|nr:hypothetical protein [Candidatus Peribacteria bacterium]